MFISEPFSSVLITWAVWVDLTYKWAHTVRQEEKGINIFLPLSIIFPEKQLLADSESLQEFISKGVGAYDNAR